MIFEAYLEDFFKAQKELSEKTSHYNQSYFFNLCTSFYNSTSSNQKLHCPEKNIKSELTPLAILNRSELPHIERYEDLSIKTQDLKNHSIVLCKMHAGLGSSVVRSEHLQKFANRTELGSKGTDLHFFAFDSYRSLAELQLIQAEILKQTDRYKNIVIQNVINFDTQKQVEDLLLQISPVSGKTYLESLDFKYPITQLKLPTVNNENLLNTERLAPAGHAFVGFSLLMDIFKNDKCDEVICIGNGEDLNSTPNDKILNWVIQNNIAITMITTTKLAKDKKGGQIAKVLADSGNYLTIVERAQAEKAGQLAYFEDLGLRESDFESLFNTNIVILNASVLKEAFTNINNLDEEAFSKIITPDLIKNVKKQTNQDFTQLEGALGSVVLNLDKYFRLTFNRPLVSFLNLSKKDRDDFFIPIKKMSDFEELVANYSYDELSGRLVQKGARND